MSGAKEVTQDPKDLTTRRQAVEKLLNLWPGRTKSQSGK